jgi:hypothetical protein
MLLSRLGLVLCYFNSSGTAHFWTPVEHKKAQGLAV